MRNRAVYNNSVAQLGIKKPAHAVQVDFIFRKYQGFSDYFTLNPNMIATQPLAGSFDLSPLDGTFTTVFNC